MSEFLEFAKAFGFPAALLLLIGYALSRAGSWAGKHVAEPLVESAQEYLRVTGESMKSMGESLQDIHREVTEHNQAHADILKKLTELCRKMDEWTSKQRD